MSDIRQDRSDIWIGAGLLAFCAFAAWRTLNIHAQSGSTAAGPAFLPWLMIGLVSLLSVAMIVRALRSTGAVLIPMPDRAALGRMAGFAILLVAYAAAFMSLGYLVSTILVSIAGLWLLQERRWLVLLLFPVAMTGVVYLGFSWGLKVWLP